MDFLDPKKARRSQILLLVGYGLVAIAIGIATLILLYQAYGYNIDKKGNVTQSGLVFVSSQPTNAKIYLNGVQYKANTNTRVSVPAGTYTMKITADGYRDWQRQIIVAGGDLQHFDYPFLFPNKLAPTTFATLAGSPSFFTESPDKRWVLASEPDKSGTFLQTDVKDPKKPVQTEISLPAAAFTVGEGQTWKLAEWSTDNQHVLLLHSFSVDGNAKQEYVLMNRDSVVDSVNLTANLSLAADQVPSLFDKKIAQFYVYNATAHTLSRVTAGNGAVGSQIDHVLAYKTYGSDKVLYVTDHSPTGKTADTKTVSVILQDGQKIVTLRTLPAGASTYLLDMAQYSGDWYVTVAADNDTAAFVYKNPQSQTVVKPALYPAPWRRLAVAHPTFVAFSANTQFVLAENAQEFAVYDAENVATYHYRTKQPLDQPQLHATWMDGDRLTYVSAGKLVVFDYDYRNIQTLITADAGLLPAYSQDYSRLYTTLPASSDGKVVIQSTALSLKK